MMKIRVDIPFKHREIKGLEEYRGNEVTINGIIVETSRDRDSLNCVTGETLEDFRCAEEATAYFKVSPKVVAMRGKMLHIEGESYDVGKPVGVEYKDSIYVLSRNHLRDVNGATVTIEAENIAGTFKVEIIDSSSKR